MLKDKEVKILLIHRLISSTVILSDMHYAKTSDNKKNSLKFKGHVMDKTCLNEGEIKGQD